MKMLLSVSLAVGYLKVLTNSSHRLPNILHWLPTKLSAVRELFILYKSGKFLAMLTMRPNISVELYFVLFKSFSIQSTVYLAICETRSH